VVGCDSIDLGFSEEDTSRMRSSPSASAGISGSHSAIVIWKRSWRNETWASTTRRFGAGCSAMLPNSTGGRGESSSPARHQRGR